MTQMMKAIIYTEFGPPDVLQLKEVEKPIPKENEVLIKNYAASVAVEDPDMRQSPGLNGLRTPKNPILGMYLAGEIETVGKNVKRFKVGDQVYGSTGLGNGAYAEYKCLPEKAALAIMPVNLNYQEAAAIPNGGLTALPFLRDQGNIQAGGEVLVNGASGAVGTAAVQLALYFGTKVTGVCSTSNIELVKSLGASQVIDYTREDFTRTSQTYDIIFDTVGKSSFSRCRDSLKQGGVYLTTVPTLEIIPHLLNPFSIRRKSAKFSATGLRPSRAQARDLASLTQIIEEGKFQAVIDKCYSLKDTAEAHRYVEKGHKKGNVVITVEHDEN